ncbi:MAG: hypothetical protein ACOX3T_06935 [Bdellovibrionota bacterium]
MPDFARNNINDAKPTNNASKASKIDLSDATLATSSSDKIKREELAKNVCSLLNEGNFDKTQETLDSIDRKQIKELREMISKVASYHLKKN